MEVEEEEEGDEGGEEEGGERRARSWRAADLAPAAAGPPGRSWRGGGVLSRGLSGDTASTSMSG